MARPVLPGQYPDPNVQADNYGQGGGYHTNPAGTRCSASGPDYGAKALLVAAVSHPYDQSTQWQTTQNVQGYPHQWNQAAGPSPSPPTQFTSPPAQYNPSAYGPMPGAQQPPQYLPPPPTYVSVPS